MSVHECQQDDALLRRAWHRGIAEASKHALDVAQRVRRSELELLPAFTTHYQTLQTLPRRTRRSLQRRWKRSLPALALLLALGQMPALAATINVGGTCNLVRAINAANNDTTAGGNCTKGSGADSIVLPANSTQTLTTINNTADGPIGLPVIGSVVSIDGNGSTIRRASGAPAFRIVTVGSRGNLTLQDTTIHGGKTLATYDSGGGVFNRGRLTVTDSTISGNSTSGRLGLGGGVGGSYGSVVTITNSIISGNSTSGGFASGGGVSGGGTITNSIISGNSTSGVGAHGAGVFKSSGGRLTLTNNTISGNSAAASGGGVGNSYGGEMFITNSTISGNSAADFGGGVGNFNGFMTLTNSTITGNRTSGAGGGVVNFNLLDLNRTLISGNTAQGAGSEVHNHNYGSVSAANFNLFGHQGLTNAKAFNNFTPGARDITATSNGNTPTKLSNILNTTLADNGGPTNTHEIGLVSPALDAVINDTCPPPARDQRGKRRPQHGDGDGGIACDIGSFERGPPHL